MILVNGNWEKIEDVEEALQIIEDNLGKEFTEKFVSILLSEVDAYDRIPSRVINRLYKYIHFT